MRSGVRRWWSLLRRRGEVGMVSVVFMYILSKLRVATWGDLEAAVHRYSLVRLNAINDSSKKEKAYGDTSLYQVF